MLLGSIHPGGVQDSDTAFVVRPDTSTELRYNYDKKFETTGAGVSVTGELNVNGISSFSGNVSFGSTATFGSNDEILLGDSQELSLKYSSSSSAAIISAGGNPVDIKGTAIRLKSNLDENIIIGTTNDSVSLYHDNSKKFETTNTGAIVTGTLVATATTATQVTVTDNESTNENNLITFVENAQSGTGNHGLEMDGNLTYNPSTGTLSATAFSGDGSALTNLPSSGISTAFTNVQATWSVGGDTSGYTFTGPGQDGAEQNPNIYLVRGQRYRFINTTGSSHPFEIRVSNGGSAYTDGITGSQSGTQEFNVQHDAPARLVYQCTVHSGMVGNIYISDYPRVLLEDDGATTSGTSIPYDGIPSWATKITLLFDRVSTTGGSEMIIQLGTSGGAITSGYISGSCNATGATIETSTAGFVIFTNQGGHNHTGKVEIQRAGTSNKWISNHMIILDSGATRSGSGVLTTYSGTIDRVVLTTEGGSQTFDNGSVTVYYEV